MNRNFCNKLLINKFRITCGLSLLISDNLYNTIGLNKNIFDKHRKHYLSVYQTIIQGSNEYYEKQELVLPQIGRASC